MTIETLDELIKSTAASLVVSEEAAYQYLKGRSLGRAYDLERWYYDFKRRKTDD